jgi:hypothetical protein
LASFTPKKSWLHYITKQSKPSFGADRQVNNDFLKGMLRYIICHCKIDYYILLEGKSSEIQIIARQNAPLLRDFSFNYLVFDTFSGEFCNWKGNRMGSS